MVYTRSPDYQITTSFRVSSVSLLDGTETYSVACNDDCYDVRHTRGYLYAPVCPYIGIGAICFRHGHWSALCARCRAHTLVTTPSAVPEPSALKRGRAREVQLSEIQIIQCHDHCPGPSRDNVIVIVTIVLQIPNHRVTCGWPRARRPWKRSRSSWHVLSAPAHMRLATRPSLLACH